MLTQPVRHHDVMTGASDPTSSPDKTRRETLGLLLGAAGAFSMAGYASNAGAAGLVAARASTLIGTDGITQVDDIGTEQNPGALRESIAAGTRHVAIANGFWERGDGGGGIFFWSDSVPWDDGGTKIKPSGSDGGWLRLVEGPISVKWFGARGNSTSWDDSDAFNAAIAYLNESVYGGTLYVPAGEYRIESPLDPITTLRRDESGDIVGAARVNLLGEGRFASKIIFNPTDDGALFTFADPEAVMFQSSISSIGVASTDNEQTKTAFKLVDVSQFSVRDIAVLDFAGGAGSVGIETRGRETSRFENIAIVAERPIVIGRNDFAPTLSADIFVFDGGALSGMAKPALQFPLIDVEPDCIVNSLAIKNMSFDGGSHGFHWDTSSTQPGASSMSIELNNIRTEKGTDPNAYSVFINAPDGEAGSRLFSLIVRNCVLDIDRNGMHIKGVRHITLENNIVNSTSVALETTGPSRGEMSLQNVYWNSGSTANHPNWTLANMVHYGAGSEPMPTTATYIAGSPTTVDVFRIGRAPVVPVLNAEQRARYVAERGMIVFNEDTDKLEYYNGASWVSV